MAMLPVVGGCLLALGLAADRFGWWTTRPFLTNLVSGVTSACFGVPFALLILASLTAHQAEQLQQANAKSLFDGALDSLAGWVRRVTASESYDRLDVELDLLTSRVLDASGPELAESVSALQKFLKDNFSFDVDMAEHWASTCAQWRFLDDYVKPRVYEQGLEWIRADAAARFDTILRDGTNPYSSVVRLREDLSLKDIRELRDALIELRSQLPKAMRLREALAIARNEPFEIGLVPGKGIKI